LAAIGAFAYFTVFSLSILAAFNYRFARPLLAALVAGMFLMTLWLLYLQAFVIRHLCQYCLLSAAVTTVLTVLVFLAGEEVAHASRREVNALHAGRFSFEVGLISQDTAILILATRLSVTGISAVVGLATCKAFSAVSRSGRPTCGSGCETSNFIGPTETCFKIGSSSKVTAKQSNQHSLPLFCQVEPRQE